MKLIDCQTLTISVFGKEEGYQPTDALFYVTDGSFFLETEEGAYTVTENSLVAFPHNMFFKRRVLSPLTFYYVKLEEMKNMPRGFIPIKNHARLLSTLSYMKKAAAYANDAHDLANHYLKDIFAQIELEALGTYSVDDKIVARAISYFSENISQKITLSHLTKILGISASALTFRFKSVTNLPPLRYLALLRIEAAEKMLLTTEATHSEIAAACGYDNAFYFSNAFKKTKGESPKSYRQKYHI